MLTAAGSPLVAGSVAPAINTMAKKVKVLRMFMWDRKPQQVGTVIEMPDIAAFEVVSSGKAEYAKAPEAAPPAPEVEANASKGRGSKKDAG